MLTTLTIKMLGSLRRLREEKEVVKFSFLEKKKKSYFWKVYTGRTKKKNRRINVNVQNTNGFRKDDDLSCRIGSFLNSGVRTKILTQANF